MRTTSQDNSPNIIIRCRSGQVVSMLTQIESHIFMSSLILLQSITSQFHCNWAIMIKQIMVQLIRPQSPPFYKELICIFSVNRTQSKYIVLIHENIELMLIIKVTEL
jgi:hypothetical protein